MHRSIGTNTHIAHSYGLPAYTVGFRYTTMPPHALHTSMYRVLGLFIATSTKMKKRIFEQDFHFLVFDIFKIDRERKKEKNTGRFDCGVADARLSPLSSKYFQKDIKYEIH